jgi:uncharacterized protein involved in exopolysaccharide biosynthesis
LYKEARTEVGADSAMASAATLDPAVQQSDTPPAQRLGTARKTLAQMQLRLSAKHPDVLRLEGLIADLERQVEDESESTVPSAKPAATAAGGPDRRDRLHEQQAELESLERQIAFKVDSEERLRAQVAAYQARLEAVPGIESEWVALTRDYDTLVTTYRDLLAKSENSKLAASLEQRQIGEQFRILDPPRVAHRPHSPNRKAINAGGLAAGLGLGLLLVVILYVRDSTMRSEHDVLDALDLPLLALVPYVRTDADVRVVRRRRVLEWAALTGMLTTTGVLVWALQLWRVVL